MIRYATAADITRIFEIRGAVQENRLRDPSRVTVEDVAWFIENHCMFVWDEGGTAVGFSAGDPCDGSIFALFVDKAYEGRGIGSALFDRACQALKEAGLTRMWLKTAPGTRVERFYSKAGWRVCGRDDGQLVFEYWNHHDRTETSDPVKRPPTSGRD